MKRSSSLKRAEKNEEGFAMLEVTVFLFAFAVMTAYTIDFFSIIHTGIVQNIAARTYLFETLEHRSEIAHLRYPDDDPSKATVAVNDFTNAHYRFHAVNSEEQGDDTTQITASGRGLALVYADEPDRGTDKTSVVWLKTGYGICVDAQCPKF